MEPSAVADGPGSFFSLFFMLFSNYCILVGPTNFTTARERRGKEVANGQQWPPGKNEPLEASKACWGIYFLEGYLVKPLFLFSSPL
jgi:hypothetical protein